MAIRSARTVVSWPITCRRWRIISNYRNLDVSTLKELAKRWAPEVAKGLTKHGKHEALADIYESIEELKYYREKFLKV